ncbi:putative protein N(5)-glutamine methyltransferase [Microlunatus panaciterrae]|uniref:peptide chain release factor N(5)-glutamine methyltransferase n=1 Tax=Microlunatus panaciterrae TaxID=400768 RepID=A0ABS2RDR6_9ACTN|nr:release factor glutamine methyltransferase [Microlunatus panaciterrae]
MIIAKLRAAGCVFAEDEARLLIMSTDSAAELAIMVERRVAGLPLEVVIGWAEFCGLRVEVDPGVFVPRRRSELLVREGVAAGRTIGQSRSPVVVDLCCGSGAVGVAVAMALDGSRLFAVDLEAAAVRCARRNVETVGGQVLEGDLYDPLPASLLGHVDILVANAPYVPTAAIWLMPQEARVHEPKLALDGGTDGLSVLRRVIADAQSWLAPGGSLLVESSEQQAPELMEMVAAAGLMPRLSQLDNLDATVIIGTRADG